MLNGGEDRQRRVRTSSGPLLGNTRWIRSLPRNLLWKHRCRQLFSKFNATSHFEQYPLLASLLLLPQCASRAGVVDSMRIVEMHVPPLSGGDVVFAQDHLAARPDIIHHGRGSVCHDNRGDGRSHAGFSRDPVSGNFTTLKAAAELNRACRIASITHDRLGTARVGFRIQFHIDDIESIVDSICGTFSESTPRDEYKISVTNRNAISKTRIGSYEILNYGNNDPLNTTDRSQQTANMTGCVFQSFVHPADAGNNTFGQ